MANLPDVTQSFRDGGLGIIAAGAGKAQAKVGMCTAGLPNTVYSFGNTRAMRAALGDGPLVEALAQQLDLAGGPAIAVAPTLTAAGSVTASLVLTGTGTGAIAAACAPHQEIIIRVTTGGALATAVVTFAVGGGAASQPVTSAATWSSAGYRIPGTLVTATFAAGSYVQNETYTLKTDGTITQGATGPTLSMVASPVDNYRLKLKIVTAGALATAAFKVALDGGRYDEAYTYGPQILSVVSGKYVIPNTGIVLTLSGSFTLDDVYTGKAATATYNTTNLTTALTALMADSRQWEIVHIVGCPTAAADAASVAGVVETAVAAAETGKRYVHAVVECPIIDGSDVAIVDATIAAAFVSFSSPHGRTSVCVTDVDLTSQITGRTDRRNLASAYCTRLGQYKRCTHPGQVDLGALPNVRHIYRDEAATPALDAARFVTCRTFNGATGYFITRGNTMAAADSDYSNVMNVRVMSLTATTSAAAYLLFVNKDLRIDESTGYIDARDADKIDAIVNAKLQAAVLDEGECSSVVSAVSRADNLLSTKTLNASVSVVPKGYSEFINVELSFTNPALALGQ